MKLQITLCLLLLLVHPRHIKEQGCPSGTNITYTISLIDYYWHSGDSFYLKLPEIEGTVYFDKNDQHDLSLNIHDALKQGLPLCFGHEGRHILSASFPSALQTKKYLALYAYINILDEDSLKSMNDGRRFSHSYTYYRERFFRFLKDSFSVERDHYNLAYGCEARAGIVSKFLGQCMKVKNYKLFIDGHIRYCSGRKDYSWVSHTLNILPARRYKSTELLVFDPFSLKKWVTLEGFLKMLADNGSSGLRYYLTDPAVFVGYRSYHKGVMDTDYIYSRNIFRYLCLQER